MTVCQFDGPNDPDLIQKRRLLASITTVKASEDPAGLKPLPNVPSLCGEMMPIPIPRQQ